MTPTNSDITSLLQAYDTGNTLDAKIFLSSPPIISGALQAVLVVPRSDFEDAANTNVFCDNPMVFLRFKAPGDPTVVFVQ